MKNSEALGICCDYLGSLRTVDLIFGKTELYQKDYLYSKGLVTNLCFNIIYLKEYLYLFLRDSSNLCSNIISSLSIERHNNGFVTLFSTSDNIKMV